jgi:predicted ATP-grasp superfamily ATP-dependent carboligase
MSLPAHVVETARAILEEARFHGISQVETKFDARDGRFKLLEVNGRSWLWIKLAAFSGVNLPLAQYFDLTGDGCMSDLLSARQKDSCFFVHDFHVKLNGLPSERRLIRQLLRCKEMVPAIDHPGEWKLMAAYHRLNSYLRRRKRRKQIA